MVVAAAPQLSVLQMCCFTLLLLGSKHVTDAAKRKAARQRRELLRLEGASDEMIWDSGLLERDVSFATVYEKGQQYYEDTSTRKLTGSVLAYVTPWNKQGYDLAVRFRSKLTHVSPVWYQLQKGPEGFVLTGSHDVNQTWLQELRQGDGGPRIVPRVILDMKPPDMVDLLSSGQEAALHLIFNEITEHGYDGIVFEAWMSWVAINGMDNDHFRAAALQFLEAMGKLLHAMPERKDLILAIPPVVPSNHRGPYTNTTHFREMEVTGSIDGWSVMTYDFSSAAGRPGANSPMDWWKQNVHLLIEGQDGDEAPPLAAPSVAKLWMGLNFYGYDFTLRTGQPQAITAKDYMGLLKAQQPTLEWEEESEEHWFQYTDKDGLVHKVWYPTPRSLQIKLEAGQQLGVGISIWELGQGLERFMDLL